MSAGNLSWGASKPRAPQGTGQKIAKRLWSHSLKSGVLNNKFIPEVSSPLYHDGQILVGNHSGFFYSLSAATGKEMWRFDSGGVIDSEPVTDGSYVFFGNSKGMVFALDLQTGNKVWDYFAGNEILSRPAVSGGVVYIVSTSREVSALSIQDGALKWATYVKGYDKKVTMRGHSPPVVVGDHLYVGFADGQVAALSILNGSVLWSRNLVDDESVSFQDIDSALAYDQGVLYVVGYFGTCQALSSSSGDLIWQAEVRGGTDILIEGNQIILSSAEGELVSFDKKNGRKRWTVPFYSGSLSAPRKWGEYLLVGSESGGAFLIDAQKGQVLQRIALSKGFLGNAAATDKTAFFLTTGGGLVALKEF